MAAKKNKKRKLNLKKLLILILILYLIFYLGYYLYKKPIENIIITGNTLVTDSEIIEAAKIKNYPSIFGVIKRNVIKNIKKIDLVEDVSVKKDLKFRLTINVKESIALYLNSNNNKIMLSSGKEIDPSNKYLGIPTLINYAPEKILKEFSLSLGKLNQDIIYLIDEIEYSPKKNNEGITVADDSFTLYMNDGNTVITNADKCHNLKKYKEIYASLGDKKGILNLDSGNYKNFVFIPYGD